MCLAAYGGHDACIEALVQAGASLDLAWGPNAPGNFSGFSPVHVAASAMERAALDTLIRLGADQGSLTAGAGLSLIKCIDLHRETDLRLPGTAVSTKERY